MYRFTQERICQLIVNEFGNPELRAWLMVLWVRAEAGLFCTQSMVFGEEREIAVSMDKFFSLLAILMLDQQTYWRTFKTSGEDNFINFAENLLQGGHA